MEFASTERKKIAKISNSNDVGNKGNSKQLDIIRDSF